jgi:hypothetical protein
LYRLCYSLPFVPIHSFSPSLAPMPHRLLQATAAAVLLFSFACGQEISIAANSLDQVATDDFLNATCLANANPDIDTLSTGDTFTVPLDCCGTDSFTCGGAFCTLLAECANLQTGVGTISLTTVASTVIASVTGTMADTTGLAGTSGGTITSTPQATGTDSGNIATSTSTSSDDGGAAGGAGGGAAGGGGGGSGGKSSCWSLADTVRTKRCRHCYDGRWNHHKRRNYSYFDSALEHHAINNFIFFKRYPNSYCMAHLHETEHCSSRLRCIHQDFTGSRPRKRHCS